MHLIWDLWVSGLQEYKCNEFFFKFGRAGGSFRAGPDFFFWSGGWARPILSVRKFVGVNASNQNHPRSLENRAESITVVGVLGISKFLASVLLAFFIAELGCKLDRSSGRWSWAVRIWCSQHVSSALESLQRPLSSSGLS